MAKKRLATEKMLQISRFSCESCNKKAKWRIASGHKFTKWRTQADVFEHYDGVLQLANSLECSKIKAVRYNPKLRNVIKAFPVLQS